MPSKAVKAKEARVRNAKKTLAAAAQGEDDKEPLPLNTIVWAKAKRFTCWWPALLVRPLVRAPRPCPPLLPGRRRRPLRRSLRRITRVAAALRRMIARC